MNPTIILTHICWLTVLWPQEIRLLGCLCGKGTIILTIVFMRLLDFLWLDVGFLLLDAGFLLLDAGLLVCWILVAGCWLLVAGLLDSGFWILVAGG